MPQRLVQRSRPTLVVTLLLVLAASVGCVSVEVRSIERPSARIEVAPMLVLVHQGGYDLEAARALEGALATELAAAAIPARTLLVTSDTLRDQANLEQARARARTVLRIMPVAGTRLDGVATRLTYDASLHEVPSDARLWHAQIEVRSGTLAHHRVRRQRRAARRLIALMRAEIAP